MSNLFVVACILVMYGLLAVESAHNYHHAPSPVAETQTSPAPAQTSDCDTLIYNMMNCISYLSNGGNDTKPESSCCSGFKKIMETDAKCICAALKSAADLGVSVNMTKASALPSACGVSSHLPNCQDSRSPQPSPANPPSAHTPPPKSQHPPSPPKSHAPPPKKSSPTPGEQRASTGGGSALLTSFKLLCSSIMASFFLYGLA